MPGPASFCENDAKLYFDAKLLEKVVVGGEMVLANIGRCPLFLDQVPDGKLSTFLFYIEAIVIPSFLNFKTVPLTHFRPMFHLCRNQVVGFH